MAKQLIEIIEIDCCYPSQKDSSFRPVPCVRDRDEMKKFEETEECFILEFDPDDAELDLSKLSISDKNAKADLLVLAEKGKVACRDFPHPRHACAIFPFRTTPRNSHCKFCYCYVCDLPAPCKMWVGNYNHCFAFDNERWNTIRKLTRQAKELQKQEACRPHQRHACVQFPFKTTSHERHCELCYCYVCEVPAPCEMWVGSQITSHCHAFSNERWRTKMSLTRQERELQNKVASKPHQRHACSRFPFGITTNKSHCELCRCYVCEVPAPCPKWDGSGIASHCHAFSNEGWRTKRALKRQERELQNKGSRIRIKVKITIFEVFRRKWRIKEQVGSRIEEKRRKEGKTRRNRTITAPYRGNAQAEKALPR